MYTIILGGSIVFLVAFFCTRKFEGNLVTAFCYGGVGVLLGCLFSAIIAQGLGEFLPYKNVTYGPSTLAAMRSSDGLSGTFVWGSGSIGQTMRYNFYVRNDDGSLTPCSAEANSAVRIIEDPSLHDVGYWTQVRSERDRSGLFAKFTIGSGESTIVQQTFQVPKGTVVQDFSL